MTLFLSYGQGVKIVGKEYAPGNPSHQPALVWLELVDGSRIWRPFSDLRGEEDAILRAVQAAPLAVSIKPRKQPPGAQYKDKLPRLRQEELARLAAVLLACVDGWGEHDYGPQTTAEKALARAYDVVWAAGVKRFGDEEFAAMRDRAARDMRVPL